MDSDTARVSHRNLLPSHPLHKRARPTYRERRGEMAEWFKAAVLKTAVGSRSPWVRIPLSPPIAVQPRWRSEQCLERHRLRSSGMRNWQPAMKSSAHITSAATNPICGNVSQIVESLLSARNRSGAVRRAPKCRLPCTAPAPVPPLADTRIERPPALAGERRRPVLSAGSNSAANIPGPSAATRWRAAVKTD